jgi:RNA polymerase sigma factor for flagellar operon FliA
MRVEMDDLIAYGELGLAEAARDYRPDLGVQFTSFAYYRVRGAIYDGLSKMSWISRARYKRLCFEQRANELLAHEAAECASSTADSEPSLEQNARWFRGLAEKLAVIHFASQSDDGSGVRDSTIEDPQARTAPAIVAQRELGEKLHHLVAGLPHAEQTLVRRIYFEGATLQEAANALGMSKSWASRLHAKALEQLGRALRRLGASE